MALRFFQWKLFSLEHFLAPFFSNDTGGANELQPDEVADDEAALAVIFNRFERWQAIRSRKTKTVSPRTSRTRVRSVLRSQDRRLRERKSALKRGTLRS